MCRDNAPSTKPDDVERQEAERKLQDLKRRRNDAESEELEKMKQKQQDAEVELEELKRKREERRKIMEEEERQRKQELEDKKAREQVRIDCIWVLTIFRLGNMFVLPMAKV